MLTTAPEDLEGRNHLKEDFRAEYITGKTIEPYFKGLGIGLWDRALTLEVRIALNAPKTIPKLPEVYQHSTGQYLIHVVELGTVTKAT